MSKKILIISTSPRPHGNSSALADKFAEGALESGNIVEKICLAGKRIEFCRGCFACQESKRCAIGDDAEKIIRKMHSADALVFATPVYFYGMSGQMKTLLDRTNSIFDSDYSFRDIYLLASAADEDASAIDGTISGLENWITCFPKASLKGVVRGVGLTNPGDLLKAPKKIKEAYEMGKNA